MKDKQLKKGLDNLAPNHKENTESALNSASPMGTTPIISIAIRHDYLYAVRPVAPKIHHGKPTTLSRLQQRNESLKNNLLCGEIR